MKEQAYVWQRLESTRTWIYHRAGMNRCLEQCLFGVHISPFSQFRPCVLKRSDSLSVCPSIHPTIHLSVCLSFFQSVCQSVRE